MLGIFRNLNLRIFILSVWMLFLELFLIRWISTEVRIFAYASNLALLACFIGIGVGCYFSHKKIDILLSFFALAITILAVKSVPFIRITDLFGVFDDSVIWSQALSSHSLIPALKGITLTLFMFAMIAAVFFPLGQLLAQMLSSHGRVIVAYSINITGSILGTWLFALLSFAHATPSAWLMLSSVCVLIFMETKPKNIYIFLSLLLFSYLSITIPSAYSQYTVWTPYQKLDVRQIHFRDVDIGYTVNVNNANYMELLNMSPGFLKSHPEIFGREIDKDLKLGQYEIPYRFKKDIKDVLIVGSGGGNDVAGALRSNIEKIDAVEIDPGVYDLGFELHPEMPYSDPGVHTYIDDARSFFRKTKKRYDVINFGLLDSHTLSSNYNNIRLDNYIYTVESFNEAKNMLKEDGIMTVAFAATRPWIAARIFNLLRHTFRDNPICFAIGPYGNSILNRGWLMYIAGNDMQSVRERIKDDTQLYNYIEANKKSLDNQDVTVTWDDWPYLYLKDRYIPNMYLCIILSLLILFAIAHKSIFPRKGVLNFHFLFLGAAFLLLEFQNISKASLLFGSTWLVNAYMITAILFLILLSNLFVYYIKIKDTAILYCLLLGSILVIYFIPLTWLNGCNYLFKSTAIAVFLNIPVFFAGVIFINSFAKYPHKDIALGSNLLGAGLGGLLESLSFVVGIKALLILVFTLYLFSYISGKKSLSID